MVSFGFLQSALRKKKKLEKIYFWKGGENQISSAKSFKHFRSYLYVVICLWVESCEGILN